MMACLEESEACKLPRGFFPSVLKSQKHTEVEGRGFPYLVAWDLVFPPSRDSDFGQAGCCHLPLPAPLACSGQICHTVGTQQENGKCLAPRNYTCHREVLLEISQFSTVTDSREDQLIKGRGISAWFANMRTWVQCPELTFFF